MANKFSVETIFSAVDHVSATMRKMHGSVTSFTGSMEKGLSKLDGFNNRVSSGIKATAGAAVAMGAAAGAVAVNTIEAGMAFEQQMANLGAAYVKTRGEIGDLEKKSLKLGASTKFSATEVAHAMEEMAKAGFTEADALAGIEGMTYAAAAAGEDLVETSANVAAVMKGMQIPIAESSMVADVLAQASVKTASSIASLGESLSKVGPVAHQLGVGFKETTAMVALLQDAGIDASEAGTATATMLTKLATPSKVAKAQMKALGITFQDAAGNMLGPTDVLQNLVTAGKKAGGNMKQMAFFAELLGLRGQKAGIQLKEAFASGKFDELVKQLDWVKEGSRGVSKTMADLRMDSLAGDLDVFTENVKGLQVELFSLNSGPLRGVVQSLTKWLDLNKADIVAGIQRGVTWLMDNLPTIVTWLERIGKAVLVFYTFATAVKAVQFAIEAYEAAVVIAKVTQWAFTQSIVATRGAIETFQALNAAAHMSKTGQAIEAVQSKLGKVGMLAAVFAVGYAFGTWLNNTFALDEKISGWVAKLTGLEDQLNKMGGRTTKKGVEGSDQHFSDGSIRRPDGTWKVKTKARKDKEAANVGKAWRNTVSGASTPLPTIGPWAEGAPAAPAATPLMVSPQDRVARSISESTETTKAEVVIKTDGVDATIKAPPKGKNFSIRLQPSGAF